MRTSIRRFSSASREFRFKGSILCFLNVQLDLDPFTREAQAFSVGSAQPQSPVEFLVLSPEAHGHDPAVAGKVLRRLGQVPAPGKAARDVTALSL
jgi:hypothetical protein